MKQTHFLLSIPEPCSESWEQMSACASGKFCGSCQKMVIDFTGYSDAQLAAFFSNPDNSSTCGLYRTSQLNRPLLIHQPHSLLYRWIMAAGIAAITLTTAGAQAIQQPAPILSKDAIQLTSAFFDDTSKKSQVSLSNAEAIATPPDSLLRTQQEGLVLGASNFGEIYIIDGVLNLDGSKAPLSLPEPTAPKPFNTQTYTGEEYDRTHQSLSELGGQ